jgi:uncharacterized OB-fold protein
MSNEKGMPVVECRQCQAVGFPPQYVCRKCGASEFSEKEIPGIGTVYTHTTIRVAPEAYKDQAPYDIAIVELNPDLRISARIMAEKPGSIRIGDKVAFQRVDDKGYWFKIA